MISIIIPSFNGSKILEKQIPGFIDFLQGKKIEHELIIVDDGSPDQEYCKEVAKQLGAQFLGLPKNKGKGCAVRKGMKQAKGDLLFYTDVDIPFEFDAFVDFIDQLQHYDVVVGDRTLPGSTYFTKISLLRKLGSDVFSYFVSRIFTNGLHDTQCGMKAFRKDIARDLFSQAEVDGFAFDVELISIAVKRGYSIARRPVKFRCNESKSVRVVWHGLGMLKDLIRIALNHRRGKYKEK